MLLTIDHRSRCDGERGSGSGGPPLHSTIEEPGGKEPRRERKREAEDKKKKREEGREGQRESMNVYYLLYSKHWMNKTL